MEESKEKLEEVSIYFSLLKDPGFAKKIMFVDEDILADIIYSDWEKVISEDLGKELGDEAKSYFLSADNNVREELWGKGHYYSFEYFLKLVKKARTIFMGDIIKNPEVQA